MHIWKCETHVHEVYLMIMENVVHTSQETLHTDYKNSRLMMCTKIMAVFRGLCVKQVTAQRDSEQNFLILEEMEHKSGLYCKWVIRVGARHDEAQGSCAPKHCLHPASLLLLLTVCPMTHSSPTLRSARSCGLFKSLP
jgi:hypothetical protein